MLIHLVKKDFLLVKKYWIVMLIAAIVLPIFIQTKLISGEKFLSFFLSMLYIAFLMFSTVSIMEDKYKGAALLCATPFTRNALVKSKYLFILSLFIGCYILYTLAAVFSPFKIGMLSLYDIGRTFFIITVIFGVIIPVQYRFGYEKSRYILFIITFLTPFVLPNIMKALQNSATESISLPFSLSVVGLLLGVLAFVVGGISLRISIQIYTSKNL